MEEENLKHKTAKAFVWNGADKFGFQLVALAVGIITARLLYPEDFGLIGALAIFTALSNILVESGFTSALIRRNGNTDGDYTAIFLFNTGIAVLIYMVLFFSAPLIADFFHQPKLCALSRFLFLSIIVNSLGIVQNIILSKELKFKHLSMADLTAAVVSGAITVLMVMNGWGYWALAWQIMTQNIVRVFYLWCASKWRVTSKPRFEVIREVFAFSSFLLLSSTVNAVVKNIYSVIIGRNFTVDMLGYYSQANKYQQIPSTVCQQTISGVEYPVLSSLQREEERQMMYMRKILRITSCIIFPVMMGLSSVLEPLVSILLTDKWLPAVPYFQLMVPAAIVLPLHSVTLSFMLIRGYAKMNLALEGLKNGLILASIAVALAMTKGDLQQMRLLTLLACFSAANVVSYAVDMAVAKLKTGYKIMEQLKDIAPYAVVSIVMYAVVTAVQMIGVEYVHSKMLLTAVAIAMAIAFYVVTLRLLGSKVIEDMINMVIKKGKI